jgi:hypothetical protein
MITDDMTPFYSALKAHGVPFFMVGQYPSFFDLFVEIPGTGTILELTSTRLDIEGGPISDWNICVTNASKTFFSPASTPSAGQRAPVSSTFPVLNWRKTTFAAPHPALAEAFTIKYLGAVHIEQGHPGVWVRQCARIAWSEIESIGPAGIPYQFHFVNGYSYPPFPPALDIVGFASLQTSARNFT